MLEIPVDIVLENLLASFDSEILVVLANVSEALNCTPLELLNYSASFCVTVFLILGMLLAFFLDILLDHVADWGITFFRWLRARWKKPR